MACHHFDTRCYDLAECFLEGLESEHKGDDFEFNSEAARRELASRIQECVEDYCDELEERANASDGSS